MAIPKFLDQIIYFIPRFVKTFYFIIVNFPDFIIRGGISVDTPFQYESSSAKKDLGFRTIIQPDAGIINFVPDPGLFRDDPNWDKLYKEKCIAHQEKVRHILTQINCTYVITLAMFIIFIVLWILLKKILLKDVDEILQLTIPGILVLLIYFLRRYIFKLATVLIGFLIRKKVMGSLKRKIMNQTI